ncbi:MAG: hypothetical protein JNJ54_37315 [Myxococcaceae bacterium]|nr:hypothetical protein [Myxococcaceae bacterium]
MAPARTKSEKAKTQKEKSGNAKPHGPEVLPSRALEHGANAFGARYLKPGVALTPELDLAFALGHGSAMGPVRLLADLAPEKKAPSSSTGIHRNVAIAALRAGSIFAGPIAHEAAPAPITEAEARVLLEKVVPELGLLPIHYRALEAMVGPSCVLPAFIDGLEAIDDEAWGTGRLHGLWPVAYGLLLRVPERESQAARARLVALFEKRQTMFAAANLDILLHGSQAIARVGYKYSLTYKSYQRSDKDEPSNVHDLCYCDGEPDFVAAQFAALWAAFKFKPQANMVGPSPARLFFLGGDKTFETELRVVDLYAGTKQGEAFEAYEHFRSPLAARCILKLSGPKSKVQQSALAWLQGQPHVAPLLEAWAKEETPDAALAKAVLAGPRAT